MPRSHHPQTEYRHQLWLSDSGEKVECHVRMTARLKHQCAVCLLRLHDLSSCRSSEKQVSLKIWILGIITFYFQKELRLFEDLDLSSAQGQTF